MAPHPPRAHRRPRRRPLLPHPISTHIITGAARRPCQGALRTGLSLGSPSPAEERQCGDINPLGITGTPVYDGTTDHVFLVAEHGGSVRHELYAVDAASGRVAWSKNVDLPGVSARDMQQRGALAIANNRVWASYGAQAGDCGDYKSRVVGIPLDGGNDVILYSPPTKRGGGIWNPNGPTVNAAGQLLVVSANGAAFPGPAGLFPRRAAGSGCAPRTHTAARDELSWRPAVARNSAFWAHDHFRIPAQGAPVRRSR